MSTGEVVRSYALLNDMRRFMNRGGVGGGGNGRGTTSDADRTQRACRNLFGPVDAEENRRFLDRQLSLLRDEQNERWNFDFDRETPLPGRFHWEPITSRSETASDAETASNDADLHLQSRIITRSVGKLNVSSSSETDTATAATVTADQVPNSASPSRNVIGIKRRRQTTISEFMPQRKRATSGEKRPLLGVVKDVVVDSDDVMQSTVVSQTEPL